jgi:hypothetical protein
MRRLAAIAAGLLVALCLLVALVLLLVDPDELREPIVARASLALGREVELGELDLAFLPVPALRAKEIRIAGAAAQDPPFAEIGELRLNVSPLPLLAGRIVLGAVALENPRLHIPLDEEGRLVLPGAGESPARPDAAEEAASGLILAVRRISVSDAELEAGPWRIEGASVQGSLALDGSAELEFRADLPGLGELRNGRAELSGLVSGEPAGEVRAELDVDLATLATLLELEQVLEGRAAGPVTAQLAAGQLAGARATLEIEDFRALAGEAGLHGDASVEAVLSEASLLEVSARLGSNELGVQIALDKPELTLEIRPGRLDLGTLSPFLSGVPSLGGSLEIESLEIQPEPLRVRGSVGLERVAYPIEQGEAQLTGSLTGRGSVLRLDAETLEIGGEQATLSGTYDLARGTVSVDAGTSEADLGALLPALLGRSELSGSLTSSANLSGPPEVDVISGSGSFRIVDGSIRGFSLLRQVFGDFASLPVLVASMEGKDLSRYEEEEFESLSADFRIADGSLVTQNLTLVYGNATAHLRGGIGLSDGALDLSGRVMLSREVDDELGKASGRQTVIPISAITGTVDSPRLRLDRQALAGLALEYASGSGRLQEKLEEALGEEGAGQVKDLLDSLLRGGR